MAKNISLLGADYPDVPAVQLPKTGGGTALFTDIDDTTATADDVASGKVFYTAAGVRTVGTAAAYQQLLSPKSNLQNVGSYRIELNKVQNLVIVRFTINTDDISKAFGTNHLFELPEGYRPESAITIPGLLRTVNLDAYQLTPYMINVRNTDGLVYQTYSSGNANYASGTFAFLL